MQPEFAFQVACNCRVAIDVLLTFGLGRFNPPIGAHWTVENHGARPRRTRHASWLTRHRRNHWRWPRGLGQFNHDIFIVLFTVPDYRQSSGLILRPKTHSPQGPGRLIAADALSSATEAVATGIALRLVAIRSILDGTFHTGTPLLFAVPSRIGSAGKMFGLLKFVSQIWRWMRGGTQQFDSVSRSFELFQCHEPRAPHIAG